MKLPPNSFYPLQIDNSGGLPLNSDARSRGVRNSVTLGFFYNPEEHSIILVRNANTTLNEIKRNILLSLVPKK